MVDEVGDPELGDLLDNLHAVRRGIYVLAVAKLRADAQVSAATDGVCQRFSTAAGNGPVSIEVQRVSPLWHRRLSQNGSAIVSSVCQPSRTW